MWRNTKKNYSYQPEVDYFLGTIQYIPKWFVPLFANDYNKKNVLKNGPSYFY